VEREDALGRGADDALVSESQNLHPDGRLGIADCGLRIAEWKTSHQLSVLAFTDN
jgi:hypothetical protein